MRVVVVSHHGLPHVGGVEVVVEQELNALSDLGHSVVHVTSDAGGASDAPALPDRAERQRIRAYHGIERRAHLAYPLFGPHLVSVLEREIRRADVVHCHGFIYQSTLAALMIARGHRIPTIMTDHGAIQRYHSRIVTATAFSASHSIGRTNCTLARRIVSFNDRILDTLRDLARPAKPDVRFVPYLVRPMFRPPNGDERATARRQLGIDPNAHVVAFVGRLNPDKGADLVAAAARDTSWSTFICGPGDVRVLGDVPTNVKVLGPTNAEGVRSLYFAADVIVAPTVPGREGFPMVIREALACGTPVVSSYEDGYRRYIGMPGLHFVDRTLDGIRSGVEAAVELGRHTPVAEPTFNPSPEQWVQAIYSGFGLPGLD